MLLYKIGKTVLFPLFKMFFKLEIIGEENIPKTSAVIIAANHLSFLDPPILGTAVRKRHLHFLARRSLFKNIFFGWILRNVHTYPIANDSIGKGGIETAIKLLEEGKAVVVFPEGTRSHTGELQKGKSGIGMVSYKSKFPVIPVYIDGTYEILPRGSKMLKPAKVTIKVGKILKLDDLYAMPPSKEIYNAITEKIMFAIAQLSNEKYGPVEKDGPYCKKY
ncbi:MAG: lysophospholipid acyltransferase family protein [Candidatus Firestonebacteria bacterium]